MKIIKDPSGPKASDKKTSQRHTNIADRIELKIGESADAIGVDPVTIRRMIKRGLLRPYRGLRTPLIPVARSERSSKRGRNQNEYLV